MVQALAIVSGALGVLGWCIVLVSLVLLVGACEVRRRRRPLLPALALADRGWEPSGTSGLDPTLDSGDEVTDPPSGRDSRASGFDPMLNKGDMSPPNGSFGGVGGRPEHARPDGGTGLGCARPFGWPAYGAPNC